MSIPFAIDVGFRIPVPIIWMDAVSVAVRQDAPGRRTERVRRLRHAPGRDLRDRDFGGENECRKVVRVVRLQLREVVSNCFERRCFVKLIRS